jgi:hypothetical protein
MAHFEVIPVDHPDISAPERNTGLRLIRDQEANARSEALNNALIDFTIKVAEDKFWINWLASALTLSIIVNMVLAFKALKSSSLWPVVETLRGLL